MALVEMENSYAKMLKQTLPDAVITSIATYELPDFTPKDQASSTEAVRSIKILGNSVMVD